MTLLLIDTVCEMAAPKRICQEQAQVHSTLSQHRLCWKNDERTGFLDPEWPHEPDIEIARKLAISCLPTSLFQDAEIASFAQGSFHRLYSISSALTTEQYLMRVALPVEPFFKTESEVATIEYVRKHSSMPVPRVVAYSSSASNELGFEWILMEKINGVPVGEVWDEMNMENKLGITVEIAGHMKQLRQRQFPLFGSIYFADIWNQVDYAPSLSTEDLAQLPKLSIADSDIGINGAFVIGRMVSTRFFRDKRLLLRPDRGPFETTQQLVMAEMKLLGRRTRHLSPSPGTDYYCGVDKLLAQDGDEVLQVFDKLCNVAPSIIPPLDGPDDAKVLWHDDMSDLNVLVDPKTHKLVGVVDWESVSVVPAWETGSGIPYFLHGIEATEPPPLGSVSEEEEEGLVEIRKDWELVLLRRKYAEIAGPIYDATSVAESAIKPKLDLSRLLGNFEDRWESTRDWLTPDETTDDSCSDTSDGESQEAS